MNEWYYLMAIVFALMAAYPFGLWVSRGWHKGKREYVDRLTRDACEKGNGNV